MKKLLFKNLLSPLSLGLALWIAGTSISTAQSLDDKSLLATDEAVTQKQIQQAKEAEEVKPGDWAYQTLQALSTKYSCGTSPTGKVLSREEFATSLNSCVQSIEQLVSRRKIRRVIKKKRVVVPATPVESAPPTPEVTTPTEPTVSPAPPEPQVEQEQAVTQQDIDQLKGLIQAFNSELQGVDTRVQALDEKVATLQKQAFSTTTKLNGEVIFSISGYGGRNTPVGTNGTTGNIFADRVRLNFDTSFTGKDLLRTRLQSRNITPFNSGVTGTNMTRLGYDGDSSNNTGVSLLKYNFPLSNDTKIITVVTGTEFNDEFYNFNPALQSSGDGAVSRFGRFNPIYRTSNDGAGVAIDHKFSKELGLALAYGVPGSNNAANPAQGSGLFNGSNVYFGQLRFNPVESLNLGVAYARTFNSTGNPGLAGGIAVAADNPFGGVATTANNYSFLASYKVSPEFILSGWAGFTEANTVNNIGGGGSASSTNYAVTLAFPDLGGKGNLLGFVFGIPPKLNSRTGTNGANTTLLASAISANPDTSYHIEALYRLKLSDNLAITPGLILITNPEHNRANPTEYVGTIRTTFKF